MPQEERSPAYWESPAGGEATKEFFVPAMNILASSPYNNEIGGKPICQMSSSAVVYFNFFIPADFNSLADAVVVMIPDTTETVQWDVSSTYSALGENYFQHTGVLTNQTQAVTADKMTEVPVSGVLAALGAGDYVGLYFQSDTTNLRVVGLRIKYT